MGLPSKLTPEVQEALVKAVGEEGVTLEIACGLVGIPFETVRDWLRLGRKPLRWRASAHERRCQTFAAELDRARAQAASHVLAQIREGAASGRSASAAQWLFDRLYFRRFAPGPEAGEKAETETMRVVVVAMPDAPALPLGAGDEGADDGNANA